MHLPPREISTPPFGRVWAVLITCFVMVMTLSCANAFEVPEGRHPIPSELLSGRCESHRCGGRSNGTCYCDDVCGITGDCCENKSEMCGTDCPVDESDPIDCPATRIFDIDSCSCLEIEDTFSPTDCPVLDPDSVTCIPGHEFELESCRCIAP